MARSYGQIMSAIWNDDEFRSLDADQQWAYLMLVTQADISSAGSLPLTVRRWSQYAFDMDADRLSDSLSALAKKRFIVVDNDTEELLVRKFVKWDNGYENPRRQPAIRSAASAVSSAHIRSVLAIELDALGVSHSLSVSHSGRHSDSHSECLSDSHPDRTRVVVTEVSTRPQPSTHNPQPTTREPSREKTRRATRLPNDWQPTPQDITWASGEGFDDLSIKRSTDAFCDYWRAESGAKSSKLDWSAAWRNWLRRDADRWPKAGPQQRPSATAKAADWMTMPLYDDRKAIT